MERYNNIYAICNEIREQLKDITKIASIAEDVNISLAAIRSYPEEMKVPITLAQATVYLSRDEAAKLMQDKMNECNAELARYEIALHSVKDKLNDTQAGQG